MILEDATRETEHRSAMHSAPSLEACVTLSLVRNFDLVITKALVPVVQRLDNAIHWIIAIQWISVNKTNQAIHQIVIYPVDRVIHLLNNPGLVVQWLEHPIQNSEGREFDSRLGHENFRCPGRAQFLLIRRGKHSLEYMCAAHQSFDKYQTTRPRHGFLRAIVNSAWVSGKPEQRIVANSEQRTANS